MHSFDFGVEQRSCSEQELSSLSSIFDVKELSAVAGHLSLRLQGISDNLDSLSVREATIGASLGEKLEPPNSSNCTSSSSSSSKAFFRLAEEGSESVSEEKEEDAEEIPSPDMASCKVGSKSLNSKPSPLAACNTPEEDIGPSDIKPSSENRTCRPEHNTPHNRTERNRTDLSAASACASASAFPFFCRDVGSRHCCPLSPLHARTAAK
eukprot:TRINITY_DN1985_c0_g1_i1.p1 TRINITY_DN1985_c0_g1~~TRINITY_DN1985_c0_g1_i1.p1  ORF type:complete len:209 (-),score=28.26 TRINITY_DN1985_c0_g1_i1:329-955(-)